MLTNAQKAFLDKVIDDERISKERLYRYLNMHDVVGSEIFPYCIEDDEDKDRVRIKHLLTDDDDYYRPMSVEDFIRRAPFFFFIRRFQDESQAYEYGDYCDVLIARYGHYQRKKSGTAVDLDRLYSSLEYAYYDLKIPTDKIFGYWVDQTGYVSGDLFYRWIDYLHMCAEADETDYFPKCFIYSYNVMLCRFGREPIIYEITESGIGEPFFRDGLKFTFEGRFPCDPLGKPAMEWIGIRANDIYDVTCSCDKSEQGYLKFKVSPNTVIHVMNFYNNEDDDEDYWYQVYAGPQTMQFDYTILKQRRTEMKLTQQQVAEAVETSIRTYQKWESGETTPDGHYLLRLMNWLDIFNIQHAVKYISMPQGRDDR